MISSITNHVVMCFIYGLPFKNCLQVEIVHGNIIFQFFETDENS